MIWAAAYCDVREDVSPPQELTYARRTDQYGSPYSEGWMEWPAGLISRMRYLEYVNKSMRIYRNNDENFNEIKEKYGNAVAVSLIKLMKKVRDYGDND